MGLSAMVSPDRVGNPHYQGSSLYNIAFNEVQNQLGYLGKSINRMDLDELLKTVTYTGARIENGNNNNSNQQLGSSMTNAHSPTQSSLSSSSSSSPPSIANRKHNFPQPLNRKPDFPQPHDRKPDFPQPHDRKPPVNDVWRDIMQQDHGHITCGSSRSSSEAFAQTALEDFIIRHGGFDVDAVNPQPLRTIDPIVAASQPAEWMPYPPLQYPPMLTDRQKRVEVLGSQLPPILTNANSIVDVLYPDNNDNHDHNHNHQLVTSMSMIPAPSTTMQAMPERKRRFSDEMKEKTIERKQKRMIKNRESAARSRQRKQAYTNQLEREVAELRKINKVLKCHKVCGQHQF
ncbi:hypothetical protein ACHQM5_016664 [Ranunculus cassubicifolius]